MQTADNFQIMPEKSVKFVLMEIMSKTDYVFNLMCFARQVIRIMVLANRAMMDIQFPKETVF
jgi:hypothetical protein